MASAAAHTLPAGDLAGAFDIAFLFLTGLEIHSIVLMLFVRESGYHPDGEPVPGF